MTIGRKIKTSSVKFASIREDLILSTHFCMVSRLFENVLRKFKRNSDDLHTALEDDDAIEPNERELINNVLDLRDVSAHDVMTPRADIMAVPETISPHDLVNLFAKTRVSRLPVFGETLDHVLGAVNIKDVPEWVQDMNAFQIKDWIHDVLFISPTLSTLDLLLEMRETGCKLAVVVDEYGGIDGMVTFAQLIEEIIGDIRDAHALSAPAQIVLRPDGSIIADARSTLEELDEVVEHSLDLNLADNDSGTLGGLVTLIAGHVPVRGELIRHPNGMEMEVLDADPRRVKRLCIRSHSAA